MPAFFSSQTKALYLASEEGILVFLTLATQNEVSAMLIWEEKGRGNYWFKYHRLSPFLSNFR